MIIATGGIALLLVAVAGAAPRIAVTQGPPSSDTSSAKSQRPSWPLLTDSLPRLDATQLAQLPSGRWIYRSNVTLRFKETVSDSAKVAFFDRYQMTVVGVTRSGHRMRTEPEILVAAAVDFTPLKEARE